MQNVAWDTLKLIHYLLFILNSNLIGCGSVVKNPPANAGDAGGSDLVPGSGRSPGVGSGKIRYSCLENPHEQRIVTGGLQSMGSQRVVHD